MLLLPKYSYFVYLNFCSHTYEHLILLYTGLITSYNHHNWIVCSWLNSSYFCKSHGWNVVVQYLYLAFTSNIKESGGLLHCSHSVSPLLAYQLQLHFSCFQYSNGFKSVIFSKCQLKICKYCLPPNLKHVALECGEKIY